MHTSFRPSRTGAIALLGLAALGGPARAQTPPSPMPTLTLAEALDRALGDNRLLRAAELRIAEARGDLTEAALLLAENPEVVASRGRWTRGQGLDRDEVEIGIEQRLEIGGQRGRRITAARAELEAVRAAAADLERVVMLAVALRFHEGLAAAERVDLAEQNEGLAAGLLDLARRRAAAGLGTPLETNAATVRLAEARRRMLSARAEREALGLDLLRLLGRDPVQVPALAGELPRGGPEIARDVVVTRALAARPDLVAAERRQEAAAAGASLARARTWPDVSLAISMRREQGGDLLTTGVRIPLLLFDRRQGERESTRAARDRATAERDARALEVAAEASAAAVLYERARDAVEVYGTDVLAAQRESLGLVQLAAEAGELDIAGVLVVQRELIEGLNGYLEARLELAGARARLLAAMALPQTHDLEGGVS